MSDREEHKTRNDSKCNPKFLVCLKRSFEANPSIYMRTLARIRNVFLSTMSRAVNRNIGTTSCVPGRCHLLKAQAKVIRSVKFPRLLLFIMHRRAGKTVITVDDEVSYRNSGVIACNHSDISLQFRRRIPPSDDMWSRGERCNFHESTFHCATQRNIWTSR